MRILLFYILIFTSLGSYASQILIPMDESQKNHLKAYGITYWVLERGGKAEWMLNYRGGSFSMTYAKEIEEECLIRGVSYQVVPDAQYNKIVADIGDPEVNQDIVKLEKAPKIAVYSPKTAQPWDDAVTLVLTYAEITYDVIYDDEMMDDKLAEYDWLHLHHEDFTGQYGKFYSSYRSAHWYQAQVREFETNAKKHGYDKVSKFKLAIAHKIRDYVTGGGFLFAMCSATDTYDIALAAEKTDICAHMFDGDPMSPNAQNELDFTKTFAFKDFKITKNPLEYEHSNIDMTYFKRRAVKEDMDYFGLFEFSAKWDPVPTMLNQCHTRTVKGFYGQCTGYNKDVLKPEVLVLGENKSFNEARYIHGEYGYGTWTFYSGHDPEDYMHMVGEPPTDLNLHPNSPGYRLILNNILFPAAKKKKQKT